MHFVFRGALKVFPFPRCTIAPERAVVAGEYRLCHCSREHTPISDEAVAREWFSSWLGLPRFFEEDSYGIPREEKEEGKEEEGVKEKEEEETRTESTATARKAASLRRSRRRRAKEERRIRERDQRLTTRRVELYGLICRQIHCEELARVHRVTVFFFNRDFLSRERDVKVYNIARKLLAEEEHFFFYANCDKTSISTGIYIYIYSVRGAVFFSVYKYARSQKRMTRELARLVAQRARLRYT